MRSRVLSIPTESRNNPSVTPRRSKLANIIKAHGYEPILRTTQACADAAVTGAIA